MNVLALIAAAAREDNIGGGAAGGGGATAAATASATSGGGNSSRLVFHERTGSLVGLSNGRRTAERKRPLDEFNNGVVMTNRPLRNEEVFEVIKPSSLPLFRDEVSEEIKRTLFSRYLGIAK